MFRVPTGGCFVFRCFVITFLFLQFGPVWCVFLAGFGWVLVVFDGFSCFFGGFGWGLVALKMRFRVRVFFVLGGFGWVWIGFGRTFHVLCWFSSILIGLGCVLLVLGGA